jgi:PAS domain S-box-containing protein
LSIKDHQCGCIRVVTGTPDPLDEPILTAAGTLYSNDLQEFGRTIPEKLYDRYRGRCIECGFASLAVLPIRHNSRIIGLIHLADQRKDMLPAEKIHILESVAPAIGEVIVRFSIEEALDRKEQFYAKLIESMFDGFAVFSENGSILKVNEALCKMTGFSRGDLVGTCRPYPFSPAEYRTTIKGNFLQLGAGKSIPIETEFLHKGGERFPVVVSPSCILDAEGKVQCYLATVKDMSGLAKTRDRLSPTGVTPSAALGKSRQMAASRPYF